MANLNMLFSVVFLRFWVFLAGFYFSGASQDASAIKTEKKNENKQIADDLIAGTSRGDHPGNKLWKYQTTEMMDLFIVTWDDFFIVQTRFFVETQRWLQDCKINKTKNGRWAMTSRPLVTRNPTFYFLGRFIASPKRYFDASSIHPELCFSFPFSSPLSGLNASHMKLEKYLAEERKRRMCKSEWRRGLGTRRSRSRSSHIT